jgi:hypothetical protein
MTRQSMRSGEAGREIVLKNVAQQPTMSRDMSRDSGLIDVRLRSLVRSVESLYGHARDLK